tara:strand:+ start:427 stop:807 length:381 start_codon:yes stop_codon:yes gene_type:complete
MSYIKKVALLFILTFIPLSSPLAHELAGGGSGFLHAITAPEHLISFVAVALMGALIASLFGSQAYIYIVSAVIGVVIGFAHVVVAPGSGMFFVGGFIFAGVTITFGALRVTTIIAKHYRLSHEQHK